MPIIKDDVWVCDCCGARSLDGGGWLDVRAGHALSVLCPAAGCRGRYEAREAALATHDQAVAKARKTYESAVSKAEAALSDALAAMESAE